MKKIAYNTPREVQRWMQEALEIVEELELDGDLRVPAFVKACDLLSGQQVFFTEADAQENVLPANFMLPGH